MARKIFISLLLIFIANYLFCQISHGGLPKSFSYPKNNTSQETIDIPIDLEYLNSLKEEDCKSGCAKHIGFFIEQEISINDNKNLTSISDGSFVYNISFRLEEAFAVGISFSKINLPENCNLFVYNNSYSDVYGSFNQSNILDDGSFSIQAVSGNTICLEFNCEKEVIDELSFVIDGFSYFFETDFFNNNKSDRYGESGDCQVNINCPEGNTIRETAYSVVKIVLFREGGYYLCSGSLINNTKQDRTPYILTAHHCAGDNVGLSDYKKWQFHFMYEVPLCFGIQKPYPSKSLIGCTPCASANFHYPGGSDFLLVKLIDNEVPSDYFPYFAGWDVSGDKVISAKGVHHPRGDVKKVSSSNDVQISTFPNSGGSRLTHLKVHWHETQSGFGTTESASSGSPLFDQYGKIVGILTGGNSDCNNLYAPDYYGSMSFSWNSNGNDSTRRLDYWLDPINSGTLALEGFNDNLNITSILFSLNDSENFTGEKPTVMVGSKLTFRSSFIGNPDSCHWEFEGAEPAFSNKFEPEPVVYNNFGTFDIRLTLFKEGLEPKVFKYPKYVKLTLDYFPNPFDNVISLVFGKELVSDNSEVYFKEYQLISLDGKIAYSPDKIEQKYNILNLYFDNVIDGIYILRLISDNDIINIKLLKTKNKL